MPKTWGNALLMHYQAIMMMIIAGWKGRVSEHQAILTI